MGMAPAQPFWGDLPQRGSAHSETARIPAGTMARTDKEGYRTTVP